MRVLPRALLAVMVVTALSSLACSGMVQGMTPTAVPAAQQDYVGTWAGGPVTLSIEPGGMCHYKRSKGGANTSIDAPVQAWRADGFDVGLGGFVKTFHVDTPPHDDAGTWKMTVDGQVLIRR